MTSLCFENMYIDNKEVHASGKDQGGAFNLSGTVKLLDVTMFLRYPNRFIVMYGKYNKENNEISGEWSYPMSPIKKTQTFSIKMNYRTPEEIKKLAHAKVWW